MNSKRTVFLIASVMCLPAAGWLHAQDAAPSDRNAVNTAARPGGMMADSPVAFPSQGALPPRHPPDVRELSEPAEQGYYLFSSPCRSLAQIRTIQEEMPKGEFTRPPADWEPLKRTHRILTEGGDLRLLALGDSIVNDTMRSGWVALLQQAYPKARIQATVYVRGGGGCQHYREEGRVAKYVLPRQPDLVFIGGISQQDLDSIREVIHQIRAGAPEVEFLLATGTFGTADPRDPAALAAAPHSGSGAYGAALQALATEERCAYLDMTTPWAEYIRSSGRHPHVFYRDVVHANEFGEQILARILMAFLAPDSPRAASGSGHAFQRPSGMPDWQWPRVQELKAIGIIQDYLATPEAYGKWMDAMRGRAAQLRNRRHREQGRNGRTHHGPLPETEPHVRAGNRIPPQPTMKSSLTKFNLALLLASLATLPAAELPLPTPVVHDLTPLHDPARVLVNPHKGWYHHFPDNHPDKYRIARDADLLEFPGMDHLYLRLAWAYLEPQEGQFDWGVIDPIIEKWTAHGLGIAFRISCKETSTDRIEQQFATPRWVMEAGAKGGHYRMGKATGPEGPWEPEFDDPIFLAKLDRFLAAFAARYDAKPWVRYIDVGSIGDWGEGHCWAGSRKDLSFGVRKQHVDLHLKHFKRAQLVISDDYVHALNDPAERASLHQHILANGVSYRDDSILVNGYLQGTSDTFTVRSPEFFVDAYLRHPTVFELEHYGHVKRLGNWEVRPDSEAARFGKGKSGPDFFRGALGLLHATYIGYHGDAREWLTDNPELTKELLNQCGYWLFPKSLELPDRLAAGATVPFTLTLENRGVAPPYTPYELRVKLSSGSTHWVHLAGSAEKSWLPGQPIVLPLALPLPAAVQPGRYQLAIGLFDATAPQERPVEFALKESARDSQGYYRVGTVTVSDETSGAEAGWTRLFNDNNLDGWVVKCRPADRDKTDYWKVVDGTITAETPPGSKHDYIWLLTEKEYGDFTLRLKVQTRSRSTGNSGIQVRSRYDDDAGWLDGPQVDINPPGPWRNGFIYDETRKVQVWLWPNVGPPANAKPEHAPQGSKWWHADDRDVWNEVQITCRGTRITTVINGVTIADYDGTGRLDDEMHRTRNVGMKGHIGLQIHPGGELSIRFKDLELQPL